MTMSTGSYAIFSVGHNKVLHMCIFILPVDHKKYDYDHILMIT